MKTILINFATVGEYHIHNEENGKYLMNTIILRMDFFKKIMNFLSHRYRVVFRHMPHQNLSWQCNKSMVMIKTPMNMEQQYPLVAHYTLSLRTSCSFLSNALTSMCIFTIEWSLENYKLKNDREHKKKTYRKIVWPLFLICDKI